MKENSKILKHIGMPILAGTLALGSLTGLTNCYLNTKIIEFNVGNGRTLVSSLQGDHNIVSVGKPSEDVEVFYVSKDFSVLLGAGYETPDGKPVKSDKSPFDFQRDYENYHNQLEKHLGK